MTADDIVDAAKVAQVPDAPVVVTITRDFGAEGHEIGKQLSLRLGIPLYDNELLVRAADRANVVIDEIAAYDECVTTGCTAFLSDCFDARTQSDKLFKSLEQVILDLGSTRTCIIEGRLSDYILRSNPNLINVLVTAPFETRVEIVRRKRKFSHRESVRLVKRMQQSREAFCRRYSAGKRGYHQGKHLVIDRKLFGVEGCVDIIAAAYYAKCSSITQPDAA